MPIIRQVVFSHVLLGNIARLDESNHTFHIVEMECPALRGGPLASEACIADGHPAMPALLVPVIAEVGAAATACLNGPSPHQPQCESAHKPYAIHDTICLLLTNRHSAKTQYASSTPQEINTHPPTSGIENAPKFSSCLKPINGGWYAIPGTCMGAVGSRSCPY